MPAGALSRLRFSMGGSACSASLIQRFEAQTGPRPVHGYGMTETSTLGFMSRPRLADLALPPDQQLALRAKQGWPVPLVEVRIADEHGRQLPWDGQSTRVVSSPFFPAQCGGLLTAPQAWGEVQLRRPMVCTQYYRQEVPGQHFTADGWLAANRRRGPHRPSWSAETAALITCAEGNLLLVDRLKDVVLRSCC